MCSLFRKDKNREEQLDEVMKKLEEKVEDTDTKVSNNEDNNQDRFKNLEVKIEELCSVLKDSKEYSETTLFNLQEQVNHSLEKQDEFNAKYFKIEAYVEKNEKEKENVDLQLIKEKLEKLTGEISILNDRLQQNSAMTMKDFTEVEMQFEQKEQKLNEKLEGISKRFESIEGMLAKEMTSLQRK